MGKVFMGARGWVDPDNPVPLSPAHQKIENEKKLYAVEHLESIAADKKKQAEAAETAAKLAESEAKAARDEYNALVAETAPAPKKAQPAKAAEPEPAKPVATKNR